jgi:hypothetical protein
MLMLSCVTVRTKLGRVNVDKITTKKLHFEGGLKDPAYACALGLLLFDPDESDIRKEQSSNKSNIFGTIRRKLSEF